MINYQPFKPILDMLKQRSGRYWSVKISSRNKIKIWSRIDYQGAVKKFSNVKVVITFDIRSGVLVLEKIDVDSKKIRYEAGRDKVRDTILEWLLTSARKNSAGLFLDD